MCMQGRTKEVLGFFEHSLRIRPKRQKIAAFQHLAETRLLSYSRQRLGVRHGPDRLGPSAAFVFAIVISASSAFSQGLSSTPAEFRWPNPTIENRPWTRWWWLGSAVDKTNLTRL